MTGDDRAVCGAVQGNSIRGGLNSEAHKLMSTSVGGLYASSPSNFPTFQASKGALEGKLSTPASYVTLALHHCTA